MELFGIGLPELIFIFVIIIVVMKPEDLQKTARNMGKWMRRMRQSEFWRVVIRLREEARWQLYHLEQEMSLIDGEEGRVIDPSIMNFSPLWLEDQKGDRLRFILMPEVNASSREAPFPFPPAGGFGFEHSTSWLLSGQARKGQKEAKGQ